jgi:hypothetical protein
MKQRDIVMKRHKIGKSTVYRQMKKETPGLKHTTAWGLSNSPVTEEEISMVHELLVKQMPLSEIRKALERHYGDNYPIRRIDRIRKVIDKRKWNDDEAGGETNFGDNLRKLFIEYSNLDLIDPARTVKLMLIRKEYRANCGVIKDALDMIIYSAENEGKSTPVINRMKMEMMVSKKLDQITKGQHIAMYDMKALESIRRSLDTAKNTSFHPDHKVLAEVCRELKPGITDVEIFMLAEKHHRNIHESTDDIVPYRDDVMRLAAEEAAENM